jgi:hypothetical protein
MEMSQGNSLWSSLKQTKKALFSFTKLGEQEGRIGHAWRGWYQWEGDNVGKGCRRVSMVQILCTYVCKCKK